MRIEKLFKLRPLLMSSLIFLLALLATGCTTTFLEYGGRMANQGSNNHVKPYQGASTEGNNAQAVRHDVRIPSASQLPIHPIDMN